MSKVPEASEVERIVALRDLDLLDTKSDPELDEVARLASAIFDVPIALLSLVDADRQWFKANVGLAVAQTGRDISFCSHAIEATGAFVVNDTLEDERFRTNPLVTGDPNIRFYAGFPVHHPTGHPVGTVCAISDQPRDFTEHESKILERLAHLTEYLIRQRRERRVLENQREQTRLRLRALAHDLASPLSAVKMRLHLLQRSHGDLVPDVEKLQRSLQSMERLAADLSSTIQGEALVDALEPSPILVADIIEDVVLGARATSQEQGVTIMFDGPKDAVAVADGPAVRRILNNLVSNALRFAKTKVDVGLEERDGAVDVVVRDDGNGLQDGTENRLFEPGFQAGKGEGTHTFGLGLYISKTLIEAQGGTIQARNRTDGTGAEFIFSLPGNSN